MSFQYTQSDGSGADMYYNNPEIQMPRRKPAPGIHTSTQAPGELASQASQSSSLEGPGNRLENDAYYHRIPMRTSPNVVDHHDHEHHYSIPRPTDTGYPGNTRFVAPSSEASWSDRGNQYTADPQFSYNQTSYGAEYNQHRQSISGDRDRNGIANHTVSTGFPPYSNESPLVQSSRGFSNQPAPMPIAPTHSSSSLSRQPGDRNHAPYSGQYYADNAYSRYSTTLDPTISTLSNIDLSNQQAIIDSDDEDSNSRPPTGGLRISASKVATKVFSGYQETPRSEGNRVAGGESQHGLLTEPNQRFKESTRGGAEDSDWLRSQKKSSVKYKRVRYLLLAVLLLAIIAGAVVGGILGHRKASSESSAQSNGPALTANSDEIKSLLNNPDLHRSFYGLDYTPLNAAEYPNCYATQNNITKDIAVMSQLTKRIRLYGNDCEQTELVLASIKKLKVDMKVWMGVYLDKNATTNERQLSQMYTLLKKYGTKPFEGVIIGNEVLFREDLSKATLISTIQEVKRNFSSLNYDLDIATADLGSNWDLPLADSVDVLMANVHPFFAGVDVKDATEWTHEFFEKNDVYYANQATSKPTSIISEVGWPSGGGKIKGSAAGVKEMNAFIESFVCDANEKGTKYFWFSAFDEPWKIRFNEPGREFEDKWGLMDVNRNLKDGIVIPDCKIKP